MLNVIVNLIVIAAGVVGIVLLSLATEIRRTRDDRVGGAEAKRQKSWFVVSCVGAVLLVGAFVVSLVGDKSGQAVIFATSAFVLQIVTEARTLHRQHRHRSSP